MNSQNSLNPSFFKQSQGQLIFISLLLVNLIFFLVLGWKPSFQYNAQRYFEIYLLSQIAVLSLFLPWRMRFSHAVNVLLVLIVVCSAIVLLLAESTWMGWRELLQYGSLFAVVMVIAKVRQHIGQAVFDRSAYLGLYLLGLGFLLISLQGLSFALMIRLIDWGIIYDAFVNVRFFAELLFVVLAMMPALLLRSSGRGWQLAVTILAACLWGMLLFSGTRSSFVVFGVIVFAIAVLLPRQGLAWLKVFLLQMLLGIGVYLLLRLGVDAYMGVEAAGQGSMNLMRMGSSGRLGLWQHAWQMFADNPWFGAGPNMFACYTTRMEASPHNIILLLLSEWGSVFTVLIAAVVCLALYRMVVVLRQQASPSFLQLSLFAAVLAMVVASMMEGMILAPLNQLLEVLIVAWAMHEFSAKPMTTYSASAWPRVRALYLLIFIAVFAGILNMTKVDLAKQDALFTLPDGSINLSYGPRYWADGHDYCPQWQQRFRSRWHTEDMPQ